MKKNNVVMMALLVAVVSTNIFVSASDSGWQGAVYPSYLQKAQYHVGQLTKNISKGQMALAAAVVAVPSLAYYMTRPLTEEQKVASLIANIESRTFSYLSENMKYAYLAKRWSEYTNLDYDNAVNVVAINYLLQQKFFTKRENPVEGQFLFQITEKDVQALRPTKAVEQSVGLWQRLNNWWYGSKQIIQ